MRTTKQQVKKQINLAKRRLKYMSNVTGYRMELDEDYFLNLQPKKAVELLSQITVKNLKSKKNVLRHVQVTDTGMSPYGKYETNLPRTKLTQKLVQKSVEVAKASKKAGIEPVKINVWSEKPESVKGNIKFAESIDTAEKIEDKLKATYENGKNNFINNLNHLAEHTGDPIFAALAKIFKEKIEKGEIKLDSSFSQKLQELRQVKINLFDSNTLAQSETSGQATIKKMMELFPISKNEIKDELTRMGYSEEEIKEAFSTTSII